MNLIEEYEYDYQLIIILLTFLTMHIGVEKIPRKAYNHLEKPCGVHTLSHMHT